MKTYKLPKEFAIKWLAALRSGNYTQGVSILYSCKYNTYCCLGVAGHICGINNETLSKSGIINTLSFSEEELQKIPEELISKNSNELYLSSRELAGNLIALNDGIMSKHLSFLEIADWVEENVEFYE